MYIEHFSYRILGIFFQFALIYYLLRKIFNEILFLPDQRIKNFRRTSN